MSEPGASPRLLTKDTAAPASPGSPSISTEAKFLSASLPSERNSPLAKRAAGLGGGGWDGPAHFFSSLQSPSPALLGLFGLLGTPRVPWGRRGQRRLLFATAPGCACPAVPRWVPPSGRALPARSAIRGWGRAPLSLSRAGAEFLPLLRLPGAGGSGRAGTARPAGAPGSPGSLARSSQLREPLGRCSPLCALGRPCCSSQKL